MIFSIFGSFLLLMLFFAGCSSMNLNPPPPDTEYRTFQSVSGKYSADVAIEKMPETILIYRVDRTNYTCKWVKALAGRLEIPGECFERDSRVIFNETKPWDKDLVVINDIGEVSYSDSFRERNFPDKDRPRNVPPDDQIVRNVTEFLKSMNLFFPDAVYAGAAHAGTERLNESKGKEVIRTQTHVFFHRELNNRTVLNSQMMIAEGENFDILYVWIYWRTYTPFREVPVRSVESAFREFTTRELWCTRISGSPDMVTVSNVTLAYYSQVPAAAGKEKYLQPVYVFESNARQGNRTSPCTPVNIPATVEVFENTG